MKYVIEFGNRGGAHVDNIILPTRELAEKLARCLVMSFENDPHVNGAGSRDWLISKQGRRMSWKSATHFVAISKLDGKPRGSASAGLWRKATGPELLANSVFESYE
jgi:hypothetical protein